jgi:hypothetical protein
MRIIIMCTLLLMLGCSTKEGSSLDESDLKDLSRQAVDLNAANLYDYYPLVQKSLNGQQIEESYLHIIKAALVIDTLVSEYIYHSGGIREDRSLMNPTIKGDEVMQLNKYKETSTQLKEILQKTKKGNRLEGKELALVNSFEYILQFNFLSDSPYFDEDKISTTPISILILEMSIVENQLYALLLKHLNEL